MTTPKTTPPPAVDPHRSVGRPRFLIVSALAFAAFGFTAAQAQTPSYFEDFTDELPVAPSLADLPAGWVQTVPTIGLTGPRTINSTDYSWIETPTSGDTSNKMVFTGNDNNGLDSANWDNYTARTIGMTFLGGSSSASSIALLTRVQDTATNQNYAAYMYADGRFGIAKDINGYVAPSITNLAQTTFTPAVSPTNANSRPYMIEMTVDGSSLTATLYQSSTESDLTGWDTLVDGYSGQARFNRFDQMIASVTATDSSYTQGSISLNGATQGGNRYHRFMQAEATAIPESSAFALLGGMTALAAVVALRRRIR